VADTSRALEWFNAFEVPLAVGDDGPELGATVGNSPAGLPFGDVSQPLGSGGTDPGGIVLVGSGSGAGPGVPAATTLIVAAEWNESALLARAVAVSVIRSPEEADLLTKEPTTSSSLWPVGKVPTGQTSLPSLGHTVNRGAPTCATLPMAAVTVTPRASATVLQTQIA
jgi:hypothetical protein